MNANSTCTWNVYSLNIFNYYPFQKSPNSLPSDTLYELVSDRRPVSPFQIKPWRSLPVDRLTSSLPQWPCIPPARYTTSLGIWNVSPHASPAFQPTTKILTSILLSDWTSAIANLHPWSELEEEGGGMGRGVYSHSVKPFNWVSGEKAHQLF